MPLYEFRCENCEKQFENIQKFSDPNPDACPFCSKGPIVKLMSRSAFILKGTGWYQTDFKGSTSGKSAANAEKPTSKAASETVSTPTPSADAPPSPSI